MADTTGLCLPLESGGRASGNDSPGSGRCDLSNSHNRVIARGATFLPMFGSELVVLSIFLYLLLRV